MKNHFVDVLPPNHYLFMYLHSGLSTVPKLIIQETPDFGPYIYIHTYINIVRGCQK